MFVTGELSERLEDSQGMTKLCNIKEINAFRE